MSDGPPYTHYLSSTWPPLEMAYPPRLPPPRPLYGTVPATRFVPYTFGYRTPGEMWREAVAEASAVLADAGFLYSVGPFGGDWGGFGCFRCALPAAPDGDVFGLGAARIGSVRRCLVPAWQAGKFPGAFSL